MGRERHRGLLWKWAAGLLVMGLAAWATYFLAPRLSHLLHGGREAMALTEAETARQLKNWERDIDLVVDEVSPHIVAAGNSLEIKVEIYNFGQGVDNLWLGAAAYGVTGGTITNPYEDDYVSLKADGVTTVTRKLTIPRDSKSDKYSLYVNLWYGQRGDPSRSRKISRSFCPSCFIVINHGN